MAADDILAAARSLQRMYSSLNSLERHLKRAAGKGDGHSMRNIDFIYMINLDTRPEKYALARRHLEIYGITPFRFSAVNGWELSKSALDDVGLKFRPDMTALLATTYPHEVDEMIPSHEMMAPGDKTYFKHCLAPGAIGCSLSHISVLQDAYDSGYETIWVLEDDIEVLDNPHQVSDLIAELDRVVGPAGWDVLFTDVDYRSGVGSYLTAHGIAKRPDFDCRAEARYADKYTKVTPVNEHFRKIAARFGTTSMVIRRSGMAKLLAFFKAHHIFLPHDLDNHLPEGIQRYGLTFDLVTNMLHSISDIGVGGSGQSGTRLAESFAEKYRDPLYQDLVIRGEIHRVGTDVCDARYELLRPVFDQLPDTFTLLDVGAAQGYFSFRVIHDYPRASAVMIESDHTSYYAHHGSMLLDLCTLNERTNVTYLNRQLDVADLVYLNGVEHFDVVLAMLVVHLMDDRLREQIRILGQLLELGDHLILEVANDVGVLHTAYVDYLADALGARVLGEVRRHKNPASTATGRLLWFHRADTRPSVSPDRWRRRAGRPIAAATFTHLNGAYP